MELVTRNSAWENLIKFDYLANKEDTIELTEWTNQEGFDIITKDKTISLTRGEIDAINFLKLYIDANSKSD